MIIYNLIHKLCVKIGAMIFEINKVTFERDKCHKICEKQRFLCIARNIWRDVHIHERSKYLHEILNRIMLKCYYLATFLETKHINLFASVVILIKLVHGFV